MISTYIYDSHISSLFVKTTRYHRSTGGIVPLVLITKQIEKQNEKLTHSILNSNEFLFIDITHLFTCNDIDDLFRTNEFLCYSNYRVRNIDQIKRSNPPSHICRKPFFLKKYFPCFRTCSSPFYLMHIFQSVDTNNRTRFDRHQYYSIHSHFLSQQRKNAKTTVDYS
jgi:hypothetical protein